MKWSQLSTQLVAMALVILTNGVSAHAQQFQSPGYRIESGSLILQPDLGQSSANYDVPASFGPDSQRKFEETGYVVISNRDVDSLEKPFIRLQLDKSQLVFDAAEVRGESVLPSSLNLSGSGANNFIASIRQDEQFKNSFGAAIPPTNCDNEGFKCTPVLAQTWKKAFGFGYRATGTHLRDFNKADAFRPLFVGGSAGKSAVIFDDKLGSAGKKLDLQFKLRPQPQTQTGIYKGTVIITVSADY